MATDTTLTADIEQLLADLAALGGRLGELKSITDEVTSDGADNVEGAQHYVDAAMHDLRLALRDIANA